MKIHLLAAAATIALTAALAGSASADSTTNWTVVKHKTTTIVEPTVINKTVTVNVTDVQPLDSEAAGLAVINSSVQNNVVGTAEVVDPQIGTVNDPDIPDFIGDESNYDIHRSSTTVGSVLRNTGIGQVNQDVGNNSNQGNAIAAGFVFGGDDLVKAEAYVEQLSTGNSARNVENGNPASPGNNLIPNPLYDGVALDQGPLVPQIAATVDGSIDDNTGVFFVNQNAGNNNQQHNALAAAIGDNALTALADAGLHQLNSGNHVYDVNTVKQDTINSSVNNNTGIVALNQSVGDNNNQATVINVASISSFVGLP